MKRETSTAKWRESTINACRTANEKLTAYRESLVSKRDENLNILKSIETKKRDNK
jgi:hypothetical protein